MGCVLGSELFLLYFTLCGRNPLFEIKRISDMDIFLFDDYINRCLMQIQLTVIRIGRTLNFESQSNMVCKLQSTTASKTSTVASLVSFSEAPCY